MLIAQANAFSRCFKEPHSQKVYENASSVTKAILEIIKGRYERMAGKAISALRPLMFAKQMKMSLANRQRRLKQIIW